MTNNLLRGGNNVGDMPNLKWITSIYITVSPLLHHTHRDKIRIKNKSTTVCCKMAFQRYSYAVFCVTEIDIIKKFESSFNFSLLSQSTLCTKNNALVTSIIVRWNMIINLLFFKSCSLILVCSITFHDWSSANLFYLILFRQKIDNGLMFRP